MDCLASQEGAIDEKHAEETSTPILCWIHMPLIRSCFCFETILSWWQFSPNARGSEPDGTKRWLGLIWLWQPFRSNHQRRVFPSLRTMVVGVSANPVSAGCLSWGEAALRPAVFWKECSFPCLPLTSLVSEKSCPLGWEGDEWYQKRGVVWKLVHVILGKGSGMGKGSDEDV